MLMGTGWKLSKDDVLHLFHKNKYQKFLDSSINHTKTVLDIMLQSPSHQGFRKNSDEVRCKKKSTEVNRCWVSELGFGLQCPSTELVTNLIRFICTNYYHSYLPYYYNLMKEGVGVIQVA